MRAALALAPRLAVERLRGAGGNRVLDVLSVLAFAVSGFLTLTVAGGTWMFYQRAAHPGPELTRLLDANPGSGGFLESYVMLAAVACALLVVPVLTLGAGAARLGARGRAGRLASLRLVGATSGEVVAMAVLETSVQACAGIVLGAAAWLLSLPAWRVVSFHGVPIGAGEMLPPWWLVALLVLLLLLLGVASTVLGLQAVRISPLGVANRRTPRAVRAWRLVVLLAAIAATLIVAWVVVPGAQEILVVVLSLVVVMLLVIGGVNLVGPWVLQLMARVTARTGNPARLVASRRIVDDPRAAWRGVSAVALLGLIATFFGLMPIEFDGVEVGTIDALLVADLRTGVVITLAVGFVVAATSTLVGQGALVVERADESRALDKAGVPRELFAAIRRRQVLGPLLVTLAISMGCGAVLVLPMASLGQVHLDLEGVALIGGTVAVGIVLTIAAAEACRPLQRRVLAEGTRRND